jgi:16S rRNA (guanine527-N7)-methyltransferase
MDAATSASLVSGAAELGVPLDDRARERFARYLALLGKWNERINLTRVVEPAEIVAKHFLDSLAIVPHLGPATTLVDVGAGAGFPGVAAAIALPDLAVTLVESIQKKAAFLEALKRELQLRLTICAVRLESWHPADLFSVAVSRATFAPPEWVESGAPLVADRGRLIAMLGRERPPIPTPPGFSPPAWIPYRLPVEGERALAIFERVPRGTIDPALP